MIRPYFDVHSMTYEEIGRLVNTTEIDLLVAVNVMGADPRAMNLIAMKQYSLDPWASEDVDAKMARRFPGDWVAQTALEKDRLVPMFGPVPSGAHNLCIRALQFMRRHMS